MKDELCSYAEPAPITKLLRAMWKEQFEKVISTWLMCFMIQFNKKDVSKFGVRPAILQFEKILLYLFQIAEL